MCLQGTHTYCVTRSLDSQNSLSCNKSNTIIANDSENNHIKAEELSYNYMEADKSEAAQIHVSGAKLRHIKEFESCR